LDLARNDPGNYGIDLSQDDDVVQYMAAVTRIDSPVVLRERIDRGDLVVNYGLQLVYRSQQDQVAYPTTPSTMVATSNTGQTPAERMPTAQTIQQQPPLVPFGAHLVMPDIWFKLYFHALTVEFEGTGVFGKIENPGPLSATPAQSLTLKQFGWV